MESSLYNLSNQFWDLVHTFFKANRSFEELYVSYESRVIAYADHRGVDRRHLRLSGEEVAGLLDFKRLEKLCYSDVVLVRTISHNIFRGGGYTDPLDRYMSQLYHEMSILKDEQYKVATIAPAYQEADDSEAYESIVAEVHEAFPRQVHGIHELFAKARTRLEKLLRYYARDRVVLRSVYLYGDEVFEGFYADGYEDVLALMFPEGGVQKGLLEVARSFWRAGFLENAIEALECAKALPAPQGSQETLALLASIQVEVDALFARLKDEQGKTVKRRAAS